MQQNGRTELARSQTKVIIGPWRHGTFGRRLGEIDFGLQAELDREDVIIRWFDHWLRGHENGVERWPAVRYFVMGSGKWKSAGAWPPPGTGERVFYLGSQGDANSPDGSGALAAEPVPGQPPDAYVYDPNDPVPTLWTRELFTVPSDRRQLAHRRDICIYRTPALEEEIEVVGQPEVVLYASSSARDTDFFARLVDEDPDGPALEACYGLVRARYRHGLEREDFLTPDAPTEFRIKLGPTACRFRKGHRLRLEITSSDFPNHDRNHNTGRNDLADTELIVARQKVFHSAERASRLIAAVERV
jgi:hypothetical protein